MRATSLEKKRNGLSSLTGGLLEAILVIGSAFVICGIIIAASGNNPFYAYYQLFANSFVGIQNIATTLQFTTPLILAGLATAAGFQGGVFNMGVEGQFYMGAMAASLIGTFTPGLPWYIIQPLTILGAMAAGSAWSVIPALMKVKLGINEIVSSIMANYIAILFTSYLVNYPFKEPGINAQTPAIQASAQFAKIVPKTQFSTGIFIALAALAFMFWLLWRTSYGLEVRTVGLNRRFSQYSGIPTSRRMIESFLISGAIAGLAGSVEIMGVYHRFMEEFAGTIGTDGIAVALLGRSHPIGIFFSSLLFGALKNGSLAMERMTPISRHLIMVLQAVVIFSVTSSYGLKKLYQKLGKGGAKA